MQLKATKGAMPMKVAQRIDVSKFMSYIKVKQLSHKKGGNDFYSVSPTGAFLRKITISHVPLRSAFLSAI